MNSPKVTLFLFGTLINKYFIKEFRHLQNFIDDGTLSSRSHILRLALLCLLLVLVCVYFKIFIYIDNDYSPTWSDEYTYYQNSKMFFENTSLHGAFTYNGKGAVIFGANVHGFAYPLMNGSIAKIFNWHQMNFIYTNLFFLLITLVIIFRLKFFNLYQKILLITLILVYYVVPCYLFSYMQEIIHVFFAIILSILLYKIYKLSEKKYIVAFLIVIFIASLFRPTWMFWSIGLIPSAQSKKETIWYILISTIYISLSLVMMLALFEPVPTGFMTSIIAYLKNGQILLAIKSLKSYFGGNLVYFIIGRPDEPFFYLITRYIFLILTFYFLIYGYVKKEKFFISIGQISLITFIVYAFLYLPSGMVRVLAVFYYLFAFTLVTYKFKRTLAILLTILVITFPPTMYSGFYNFIVPKKQNGIEYLNNTNLIEEYSKISSCLLQNSTTTVLLEDIPEDGTLDYLALPLKNASGHPINYIVNYFNAKLDSSIIDYVLTKPDKVKNNKTQFSLILECSNYKLYKFKYY